jgi:hypothetical protein
MGIVIVHDLSSLFGRNGNVVPSPKYSMPRARRFGGGDDDDDTDTEDDDDGD